MKRLSVLAAALGFLVAGCGSSTAPTTTPPTKPTFTATLSPANEVPPIVGAEAGVTGDATITIDATKDSAGNITAATATFVVNVRGLPATSSLTNAHIHEGATTCACPVVWQTNVTAADLTITGGTATFTKAAITPSDVAVVQRILNNPSGFYFNVHSAENKGGVARGILVVKAS
jgi:hypothetical protein